MLAKNNGRIRIVKYVNKSEMKRKKTITGEIERNTERCAQFIVSGVALPDRGIRVVHACKDPGFTELGSYVGEERVCIRSCFAEQKVGVLTNFPDKRIELLFRAEWYDQNLCRSNRGRQGQNLMSPQIEMKIASV